MTKRCARPHPYAVSKRASHRPFVTRHGDPKIEVLVLRIAKCITGRSILLEVRSSPRIPHETTQCGSASGESVCFSRRRWLFRHLHQCDATVGCGLHVQRHVRRLGLRRHHPARAVAGHVQRRRRTARHDVRATGKQGNATCVGECATCVVLGWSIWTHRPVGGDTFRLADLSSRCLVRLHDR